MISKDVVDTNLGKSKLFETVWLVGSIVIRNTLPDNRILFGTRNRNIAGYPHFLLFPQLFSKDYWVMGLSNFATCETYQYLSVCLFLSRLIL